MFFKVKTIFAGAAIALIAGQANAATYSSGQNAAGATVVAPTVSKTITTSNVSNISAHLDALIGGGFGGGFGGGAITSDAGSAKQSVSLFDTAKAKGNSAGNDRKDVSVWANGSFTWVDNSAAGSNFDGDVGTLNIGIDKWFNDKLLAGVSVGYSKTDISTTFNSGTYEEDTVTLAPYGLIKFTDNFNVAGTFGHSWGDVDQNRQNGATTSSTDAETWFAAGTATYSKTFDKLGLAGRVGYLWADRDTDGYIESNNNVVAATAAETSQGRIGAEASYLFETGSVNLSPFASVDYLYDFEDEINNDADAFDTGLGLRIGSKDGSVDGSISVKTQLGRSDFDSTTASATLRFNF